jgi:hypothetical protein
VPKAFKGKFLVDVHIDLGPFDAKKEQSWYWAQ